MYLSYRAFYLGFSIILRFKTFGGRDPHRPAEDVAFSVARFFQKGGSVHNYYMVQFFSFKKKIRLFSTVLSSFKGLYLNDMLYFSLFFSR